MKKTFFRIFGFLFILILLISCNNLIEEQETEKIQSGKAKLVLNINNNDVRTITPTDIPLEDMYYTLTGTLDGEDSTIFSSLSYTNLVNKDDIIIDIGTWSFTLLAKKQNDSYYEATLENIEIVDGTNSLLFELKYFQGGAGNLSISLTCPNTYGINKIQYSLYDMELNLIKNTERTYSSSSYSDSGIPSGNYVLVLKFYKSSGDEIPPGYSELVQIRNGRTSYGSIIIEELESLYKVNYNLNGGEFIAETIPMSFNGKYGMKLPTAEDISKKGYEFAGWYTKSNFTGEALTRISANTNSSVTLYAKWSPLTYNITYENLNEAEHTNPATYTVGDYIQLLNPSSHFAGETFNGWTLPNGESISSISGSMTGDISLIANWSFRITTDTLSSFESWVSMQQTVCPLKVEMYISEDSIIEQLKEIAGIIKEMSTKQFALDLYYLKEIPDDLFNGCSNLVSIKLSSSDKFIIGKRAFYDCINLKEISLTSAVSINENAFYNCSSLTKINISERANWQKTTFENNQYTNPVENGARIYLNGVDITDNMDIYKITYKNTKSATNSNPSTYSTKIGLTLANLSNLSTAYFVGWELNGNIITKIPIGSTEDITLSAVWKEGYVISAENASKNLSSYLSSISGYDTNNIIITGELTSDYIKSIGDALRENPTKYVSLDFEPTTGLTVIPNRTFQECANLKSIIIPSSVTKIGENEPTLSINYYHLGYVFAECTNLESITIPRRVTMIDGGCFNNCDKLKKVYIESLAAWCEITFYSSFYSGFGNPLSQDSKPDLYLNGEKITNLVIPSGVTTISEGAFYKTSFESVKIPSSVTTISESAFEESTIKSVSFISSGLTTLEKYAFKNCKNLTNITIPSTTKTIQPEVFYGCENLTSVTFQNKLNWGRYKYESDTSPQEVLDLSNSATNAENLKSDTWGDYYLLNK